MAKKPTPAPASTAKNVQSMLKKSGLPDTSKVTITSAKRGK